MNGKLDISYRYKAAPVSTETELLKHFFAAINRNDMQAIVADLDPEIVRVEPDNLPAAGTYRGIDDVQQHVRETRGKWAEGTCDPEKFLENGAKAVVYLHARVRLHDSPEWIDGRFADGFVFRDERILEWRTFTSRAEALRWAGIEDPL